MVHTPMAPILAASTSPERPGSRGLRCARRASELKSSMRFSRDRCGGVVRQCHGQRDLGSVVHPVRREGGYVHPVPWGHGVRVRLLWQGLHPPLGAVPVPVDLVPSNGVAVPVPEAEGLTPADLHQQVVLNVEVDRRDRIRG